MTTHQKLATLAQTPRTERMPVLFVGHGSPMNAIEDNVYAHAWEKMGASLPRPRAILSVSAHWFVDETLVHGNLHPKTIYDFYRFPEELYRQTYPCPGSPEEARAVQQQVKMTRVGWDLGWGLDHGTWIVTKRMFPQADIPVFQMSLDYTKPSLFHYDLGRELRALRDRGILLLASGNIVHNLGVIRFKDEAKPFEWALEFDALARQRLDAGDHAALVNYATFGQAAALSVPTPDHYWPLLYALGAQYSDEKPAYFAEGVMFGSVSMTSFRIG